MLGSIVIKDGIILYHIGYGVVLGYPATSGIIVVANLHVD
jgi:hypothetical protein